MEKKILHFLLKKHIAGELTAEEKEELATYLSRKQRKESIVSTIEELMARETRRPQNDEQRFTPSPP